MEERTPVHITVALYDSKRLSFYRSTSARVTVKPTLSRQPRALRLPHRRECQIHCLVVRRALTGVTALTRAPASLATLYSRDPTTLPATRIRFTTTARRRCAAISATRKRPLAVQTPSPDIIVCVIPMLNSPASTASVEFLRMPSRPVCVSALCCSLYAGPALTWLWGKTGRGGVCVEFPRALSGRTQPELACTPLKQQILVRADKRR